MTTKKLTDKQKDKLKKSKFVRSNSDDITVNPSFKEDIEYDEEYGTLSYDRRTKEGKEIERILNSRNRKSKSDEGDYCDVENESKSEFNDKENSDDSGDEELIRFYRGYAINYSKSMNTYFACKNGDSELCDDNLECLEKAIDDFLSIRKPAKPNTDNNSDCVYCRYGVCKNDEGSWYYNQECPGECDYFYRK